MEENKKNGDIIKRVLPYWPFILLIGAIIFQAAQAQMKNTYQDSEISNLNSQQATVAQNINDIKNSIIKIETLLGKYNEIKK